jgi:hypothetical protein
MASFRCLNFNNGQSVNLGFLTKFWGLSGYSPIETIRPTGLNLNKLKSKIQEIYDADVPGAISHLNGGNFSSVTEAMENLETYSDTLLSNVYWLTGSLYEGGIYMYSAPNSNTVAMNYFHGLFYVEGIPRGYYTFRSSTSTFSFRVYPNNDSTKPLIDNVIYFFNVNSTTQDAPAVNHVYDSEHMLWILECTSLGVWGGLDIKVMELPERWEQSQGYIPLYTPAEWGAAYLVNYTEDPLNGNMPHPWERWMQYRSVPNRQFTVGLDDTAGELVGGYIPIENSNSITYDDDDPSGGDAGGPSGGDGDKDGTGTDIDTGEVPSSNFLQTGISRIYLPDQTAMTAFCHYVFSDITQSAIDQLKKMWSNPLDYVENLAVCRLAGIPSSGVNNISFGGIDSGVSSSYTVNAFHQFDYECDISEFWRSALDYANYTKLKIMIPYCGLYDLNTDEFMMDSNNGGCKVTLRYRVDLMSGMCVAMVRPSRVQYDINHNNLNSFLYQFNGNIYLPLSLTATDWRNTYQSVLGIAGGMIAPSPTTAMGMASDIMGQKVNVQHSGSIGTNFGYMGIQEPYIIIERPTKSEPKLNNSYSYRTNYGYPSNKLLKVSQLSGFVKARKGSFWCQNLHATDDERKEIIALFENEGVWLD